MRNTIGGKKYKKQGNNSSILSQLVLADNGQSYGKVTKILGHSKFKIQVFTSTGTGGINFKELIGNARPGLKKKRMFISNESIVLVSLRDFQSDICDIIHVYHSDHVNKLVKLNKIPKNDCEHRDEFEFEGESESDSESDSDDEDKAKDKVKVKVKAKSNANKINYMDMDIETIEEDEDVKYDTFGNTIE